MSKLRLYGDTSGYIDVAAPATADNSTLDLSTVVKEDANGNVGIGTDSPTKPLHIYGNTSNNHQIRLQNDFGSGADWTLNAYGANGTLYIGNNLDRLMVDGSGRVTMPYQPAFLVGFGATNTISLNDGDQIQFDNDSAGIAFDNGNNFDTSGGNHSFTAPVTGIYSFNLTVKCSTVGNFSGVLKVNGANANIVDAPVGFSSSNDSCVTTLLIKLNANDYVKAHTRNGNYQLYKGHTFWSGHLVG